MAATFDEYWKPQTLTDSLLPRLVEDEVSYFEEQNVHIYHGEDKVHRNGTAYVTSHRVVWLSDTKHGKKLMLQLKLISKVEKKHAWFSNPRLVVTLADYPLESKSDSPDGEPKVTYKRPPQPGYLQLSFHKGGVDKFLETVESAIKQKRWKPKEIKRQKMGLSGATAGIGGIMRKKQQQQQREKQTVGDSFGDLDTLMKKAGELVDIATKFSESKEADEKKDDMSSMLHDLGIVSPITKGSSGGQYHSKLARQLADFLKKPLQSQGGMMTLTDAYCLFNRALGTKLVSPDDLLNACQLFPKLDLPMKLRKFDTGVLVIQSVSHNEEQASEQIVNLIQECGPLYPLEVSQKLHISINLAREQMFVAEQAQLLCRDEHIEGVRFYLNFFKDVDVEDMDLSND